MTGSGRLDSKSEARFWLPEVEAIVQYTRDEAEREGFTVPENFARTQQWRDVVEKIEIAVAEGDYIKTRDLCRDYAARAVKYCQGWLSKQRAKGVAA